jgi:hypothetical protein
VSEEFFPVVPLSGQFHDVKFFENILVMVVNAKEEFSIDKSPIFLIVSRERYNGQKMEFSTYQRRIAMRKQVASFFILLFILIFPHPGEGQVRKWAIQFSPAFGIIWTDVTEQGLDLDPRSALIGLEFSRNITGQIAIDGSFHWSRTRNQDLQAPLESTITLAGAGAIFHLTRSWIAPYVRGGFGYIGCCSEAMEQNPDNFYYSFGGGFKFLFNEEGGIGIDFRDIIVDLPSINSSEVTLHNISLTASAIFQFGGRPVKDRDNDGIYDGRDKCPDTPHGTIVDDKGCPLDSDKDGIFDGLDKCPDTPKHMQVGNKGCPRDSDGDGIHDWLDKCPDTRKRARVDADGCPKDTDGDGVYDGLDKCPGTLRGFPVDEEGCRISEEENQPLEPQTID